MNKDSEKKAPAFAPITLADIDELRAALGAAAEVEGARIQAPIRDTIMCPSSPWDQE
jgi:hypothetical protein